MTPYITLRQRFIAWLLWHFEGYKTMDACLNGVQSVKNNAPEAELIREEAEEAE